MKNCLLILPYFGEFPNYFPLFLRSCGANPDFNWLLITDQQLPCDGPENVLVRHMTFQELKKRFQEKFDFPIALEKPYKLCDYRPAYGYLMEDMLRDYQWWGHCDCDLIFGDLSAGLLPLLAGNYDKLFAVGHLTLYRNNFENNRRFMLPVGENDYYKRAFQTPENCWFDEDYWSEKFQGESIHRIFRESEAGIYETDLSFNVSSRHSQFYRAMYVGGDERFRTLPFCRALYYYERGKLKRMTAQGGRLETEGYLYMHFQSRTMSFPESVVYEPAIQIYPNGFRALKKLPETVGEWEKMTRYSFNSQWFRMKWGNFKRRFRKWTN